MASSIDVPHLEGPILTATSPSPAPTTTTIHSLPPELLYGILALSVDRNAPYLETKADFSRLCLVSHQFLPIAREHLYHNIQLFSDPYCPERGIPDFATASPYRRLVRELHVAVEGGPLDCIVKVTHALLQLFTNVQKVWFLRRPLPPNSERQNEEEEPDVQSSHEDSSARGQSGSVDDEDVETGKEAEEDLSYERAVEEEVTTFCKTLVKSNRKSLKVLVVSHLPLRSIDTGLLFAGLPHLQIFKGDVFITPSDTASPSTSAVRLRRLWITSPVTLPALRFMSTSSADSLRFLHLTMSSSSGPLSLDFPLLEQLCITCELDLEKYPTITSTGALGLGVAIEDEPYQQLVIDVVATISSVSRNSSLKSVEFSIDPFIGEGNSEAFKRLGASLPRSIVSFAIGPGVSTSLPSSFLVEHLDLYPSLRLLRVGSEKVESLSTSGSEEHDDNRAHGDTSGTRSKRPWYRSPVLLLERPELRVVEMRVLEWKEWENKEFYPEGKEKEWKPSEEVGSFLEPSEEDVLCVIC